MRFVLLLICFSFISAPALAQCVNPDGVAGVQVYNSTHNVMQYCDGDKWIGMGGGSSGATPDLDAVLTEGNAAGGKTITGLAAPTANNDAATKAYADGKFGTLTNDKWCRSDGTQVIGVVCGRGRNPTLSQERASHSP